MRILLIEDETDLASVVRKGLSESGFTVDVSPDGEDGLFKAQSADYDVVVLDLMLPRLDGFGVLEALRKSKRTPVLMLTARDAVADRVRGLNLGADDYLAKPFDFDELIARIRALIRRSAEHPSPKLQAGDVELDTASRIVTRAGVEVELAAKEYAILELLLLHRDKLVTRGEIYECIYGDNDDTLSNVLDVYISNLRRKLGADLIQTRRGVGYTIRV